MGIVSDDDFDLEQDRLGTKSKQTAEVKVIEKGRGNGNVEVPNPLRNIIGETAITDGRQEAVELGKMFGVSPSSVSAYSAGATSTASYDERPNRDVISKTKQKISLRARNKLMRALKHITEDKLAVSKASELAGITKDLSAVVKNMEDNSPVQSNSNTGPTFVFYSPQFRKEEHFDIVPSKE